jgi:hypothetical protein
MHAGGVRGELAVAQLFLMGSSSPYLTFLRKTAEEVWPRHENPRGASLLERTATGLESPNRRPRQISPAEKVRLK